MAEISSVFERHMQTGIQCVLVALLTWAGYSLNQLQQGAIRQEERLISLQAALSTQDDRIGRLENGQVDLRIRVDRLEQH